MKLLYPAVFTPFDEGDGYTVEVPDLKGCVTEGDNMIEAIEMAVDAASGFRICYSAGSDDNLICL